MIVHLVGGIEVAHRLRKNSLNLVLFCVSGIDTYISVLILHSISGTTASRIMSGFQNPTHKENQ